MNEKQALSLMKWMKLSQYYKNVPCGQNLMSALATAWPDLPVIICPVSFQLSPSKVRISFLTLLKSSTPPEHEIKIGSFYPVCDFTQDKNGKVQTQWCNTPKCSGKWLRERPCCISLCQDFCGGQYAPSIYVFSPSSCHHIDLTTKTVCE